MSLVSVFQMGFGSYQAHDHLFYARGLFRKYADAFQSVDGSNGLTTTLTNYLVRDVVEAGQDVKNSKLGEFILQSCTDYLQAQGFDTSRNQFEITNVWLNEMVSESNHKMHSHSGNIVSGCFYVDVPENSGTIMFSGFLPRFDYIALPVKEYTYFNSDTWTVPVQEGQLLCWNSYVQHGVPEQSFKGKRRSIAFDVSVVRKENS